MRQTLKSGLLLAVLAVAAVPAAAERAPIVDSMPMGGAAQEMPLGKVPPAQGTPYYGPASRVNPQAEMLYQLDLLQQEVQNLRGQVEQYVNEIGRIQEESTRRYRGLDSRMTELEKSVSGLAAKPAAPAQPQIDPKLFLSNPELLNDPKVLDALDKMAQPAGTAAAAPEAAAAAAAAAAPETTTTTAALTEPPVAAADATATAGVTSDAVQVAPEPLPDDEQAAYDLSRELIKRREFPRAAATLQSFIGKFPGGQYEGHAWYWLGEVYMVIPDAEAAKQSFNHLLEKFPGHPKEADATYKLAVVHDQLGDAAKAREFFQRVIDKHDGTSAASLAANYLRFMGGTPKAESPAN